MQPPQAEAGHPVQKRSAKKDPRRHYSSWYCQSMHKETTLEGCHDKIGHLGLKRILNLMQDHFLRPQMAVQVKEHVKKCCQCVTFKAKEQKAPMEVL